MVPAAGRFSVQKLSAFLICLCIAVYVLYTGSGFFIPIAFGVLFAFMLKPICDRVERASGNRVVAILITLLLVTAALVTVFGFFIVQIRRVLGEADGIVQSLREAGVAVMSTIGSYVGLNSSETLEMVNDSITSVIEQPLGILSTGLSTSGALLTSVGLIIIYVFFFLLYRTAVKRFMVGQFRDDNVEGEITLREIQRVASGYLRGMLAVMVVLAVLNTAGLSIIGIRYAVVWGTLGALLAVIPYVGTVLGGLLPLLYAIATTGTVWQPVAVVGLYAFVQFIEGNFITPKVVGNSVKINALAAIVAILLGAALWGLAGVILAIPLLAMVRVVLDHIDPTKPIALLLSDDLYEKSEQFITVYNEPRYRLKSLFNAGKAKAPKFVLPGTTEDELAGEPVDHVRHPNSKVVTKAKPQQRDGDAGRKQTLVP